MSFKKGIVAESAPGTAALSDNSIAPDNVSESPSTTVPRRFQEIEVGALCVGNRVLFLKGVTSCVNTNK